MSQYFGCIVIATFFVMIQNFAFLTFDPFQYARGFSGVFFVIAYIDKAFNESAQSFQR